MNISLFKCKQTHGVDAWIYHSSNVNRHMELMLEYIKCKRTHGIDAWIYHYSNVNRQMQSMLEYIKCKPTHGVDAWIYHCTHTFDCYNTVNNCSLYLQLISRKYTVKWVWAAVDLSTLIVQIRCITRKKNPSKIDFQISEPIRCAGQDMNYLCNNVYTR